MSSGFKRKGQQKYLVKYLISGRRYNILKKNENEIWSSDSTKVKTRKERGTDFQSRVDKKNLETPFPLSPPPQTKKTNELREQKGAKQRYGIPKENMRAFLKKLKIGFNTNYKLLIKLSNFSSNSISLDDN